MKMLKPMVSCFLFLCVGYLPKNLKFRTYCELNEKSARCGAAVKNVQFLLYTRSNQNEPKFLQPNEDSSLSYDEFNPETRTVMFIHGLGGSAYGKAATLIKNRLLEKDDYNVILVNWKNLATVRNYCSAIDNSPIVASYTARLILWLTMKKLISIAELHIIGFSLGAHISGLIGATIFEYESQKIGRITGLDPAGPIFELTSCYQNTLHKSDASFVDVIHTNNNMLGLDRAIGHVDFYPNYGKQQPGCGSLIGHKCSHSRAWRYFAESIIDPYGFRAAKCKKWVSNLNKCNPRKSSIMGFSVSKKSRGIYILKTNPAFPFAKYSAGLRDDKSPMSSIQDSEN